MPTIHLTTFIAAPVERVFNLSRSIELHRLSMQAFGEEAVAGIRNGLINNGETVTWRAKHLLKKRILRVKIIAMKKPEQYTSEQLTGDFKEMKHEHWFKPCDNGTIMIDLFHFETPYGVIGRIFNKIYFSNYIKKILEQRNSFIRDYAETEKWKNLLIK